MKIKDLTEKQGLELAKLCYSSPELITDYKFKYQPYDETWYADAREFVRLTFKAPVFGDKVEDLMIEIGRDLNVNMFYWNGKINSYLPVYSQYKIHQKFIEWGIEPS